MSASVSNWPQVCADGLSEACPSNAHAAWAQGGCRQAAEFGGQAGAEGHRSGPEDRGGSGSVAFGSACAEATSDRAAAAAQGVRGQAIWRRRG